MLSTLTHKLMKIKIKYINETKPKHEKDLRQISKTTFISGKNWLVIPYFVGNPPNVLQR